MTLIEKENSNELVIQCDSLMNPSDTNLNPLFTTGDSTMNPFMTILNLLFSTGDLVVNPIDSNLNPLFMATDTVMNPIDTDLNPNFITDDTVVDKVLNPIHTSMTMGDIASPKIIGVPEDRFDKPSKGSRNNQVGSVRLDDKEFEKFSEIAQDLGLSNYNLLHRVIRNFIENPHNNEGFNSDTIRKEEKARYAEKIKGLMPITTHEKLLRDETEIRLKEITETNNELKEAINKLAEIQNSDVYIFLLSNHKTVDEIMKFMAFLKTVNQEITPKDFINSYRNIQRKLKSSESNFNAELDNKLKKQSEEFIGKVIKVLQELCDIHTLRPFSSGKDMYYQALHKLGII